MRVGCIHFKISSAEVVIDALRVKHSYLVLHIFVHFLSSFITYFICFLTSALYLIFKIIFSHISVCIAVLHFLHF